MTARALWWRQLRADLGAVATLAVLLAVTSFLLVAGPRWLNAASDDAVQYELRTSPEIDDVLASYPLALPDVDAANGLLNSRDEAFARLQPPLHDVVGPAVVTATAPAATLLGANDIPRDFDLYPIEVTLQALVDPSDAVRFVSGTPPAATNDVTGRFPLLETYGDVGPVRVVEVAMTAVSAEALGADLGDELTIGGTLPVVVRLAAVFEPVDPGSYVWARHGDLLRNSPVYGLEGLESDAVTLLVTPESLDSLAAARLKSPGPPGQRLAIDIAYPLIVDDIDAGMVTDLVTAADRAESDPVQVFGGPIRVTTSIQAPLQRFVSQRSTAYAVLAIGIAGLAVSGLTVLVLAARLVMERRRSALALARARGASVRQLAGTTAVEGLLVALVGGGVGATAAVLAVDARSSTASVALPALLVVITVVVLAAIVAAQSRRIGVAARRDLAAGGSSPPRVAAEVGVVVLAVGGVLLLRQRGLTASVVDGSIDPYLVTVPVLVALATALLVLRAYPLVLQAISGVASGGRGLVGFLGLARGGREPAGAAAPVVVLLVGLSFAIFASVVLHSVQVAQEEVSWGAVGAPLRVDGTDFDPDSDIAAIAASAGIASSDVFGVHVEPTATVRGPTGSDDFDLLMLDPVAYQAFVSAYPIGTKAFDALRTAPSGEGERIPALVSPALQTALHNQRSGDVAFRLPGTETDLHEVGVLSSFHGFDADELWAVARTTDVDLVVDLPYWPSVLFLDAPQADPAAVLATVRLKQPFALIASRQDLYDAVAAAPLVRTTASAFSVAVLVTAGYCLFAIALSMVVASRPRSRFLSYLRTLGLSERQARSLVGWEILPPAAVATVGGAALGLLLPGVVLPALDLRPFTGGLDPPSQAVDTTTVAGLTLGLLMVVAIAAVVTTSVNRRRQLGAALRVGESS